MLEPGTVSPDTVFVGWLPAVWYRSEISDRHDETEPFADQAEQRVSRWAHISANEIELSGRSILVVKIDPLTRDSGRKDSDQLLSCSST